MIEINGHEYDVPQPYGMRSFAFQQRVIPVASQVAKIFLSLIGETEMEKLSEADVLRVLPVAIPGIGEVFANMPHGELEAIARTLLGDPRTGAKKTEIATRDKMPLFGQDGGDLFDTVMRGRTADTWKLLWHAVGVWYPDFFDLARSFRARAGTAKGQGSKESGTSPGPGQDSASS